MTGLALVIVKLSLRDGSAGDKGGLLVSAPGTADICQSISV